MTYRDDINVLRLMQQGRMPSMGYEDIEEGRPDGYGAPAYPPMDFGQMERLPQPVQNVLAEALRLPEFAPPPNVMPRTSLEDPRRYKVEGYNPETDAASAMPMNAMRDSQTGEIRSMNFGGGEAAPTGEQPDYSRPIEIAGVGKGFHAKGLGGKAIINGKVHLLGVDREASWKAFQRAFQRDKGAQELARGDLEMEQTREQIAASRAQRSVRDDPASPAFLNKRFGAPEKGKRWTQDGRLEPIPGGEAEQQQTDAVTGAQETIRKIDDMLADPGLSDAVGMKKWGGLTMALGMDPTGGTDAANFKTRLDEIQGGAFLEAFEKLKGGGAISEVEGKKATAAITRMSTAQTEVEFRKAAQEFRNVIETGMRNVVARGGGARRIQNDAEYAALPRGAEYVAPDGKRRRKA